MKIRPLYLLLVVPVLTGALIAAEPSDVSSPANRAEVLTRVTKLFAAKDTSVEIANPFYPAAFGETTAETAPATSAAPAGPRSASALLQAIATNLKPSGYFVIGGRQTLVFGQKRINAGGLLTVTYEGTEYTLEITAIDRTNFTLRLNREEFTRPIK